jgi:hypothetical protein
VIADFTQPGPHDYDGLLVLDANEIDDLTAIITLCAILEVRDACFTSVPLRYLSRFPFVLVLGSAKPQG